MSVKGKKVGFVGAGNMGEALIKGLATANLVPPETIAATDARAERAEQMARQYGIRAVADNGTLVRESDVVVLAVKPQIMAPVLREIAPALTGRPLLISLAAGVSTARMHPHMLRHTFVTTMLDAGVDLRDVQIAARHADPRTTMRYDRARKNLDRHPNYVLAAYMASGT